MIRRKKFVIWGFLILSFSALSVGQFPLVSGSDTQWSPRPAYVPGELLVKYKASVRTATSAHFQSRLGVSVLRVFDGIGVDHVRLPAGMRVGQALDIYRKDPGVEYAEPNYYRYAAASPDDTYFDRLWGLHNTGQAVNGTSGTQDADIDAPEAWDTATGSSGIVVAVIDSGVDYNHPDLANNIWSNSDETEGNSVDDDGNGYVDDIRGWDFVDNDNDPIDPNGHGTHVAGTIAAEGNNDLGIVGVCWIAKIMPLRALDAVGVGTVAQEIEAINYAKDNGAHVINASLAGPDVSRLEEDAIESATSAGILFVAGAGNDGTDNDSTPVYPASYDISGIIAVAATNQNDSLAWYSNYGATSVDVAAPGSNIFSAKPDRQTAWSDNFDDGSIVDWTVDVSWALSHTVFSSGTYSLATSPTVDYVASINISAVSPAIDLSGETGAKLTFKLQGKSEPDDLLYVETATAVTGSWTNRTVLVDDYYHSGISGSYSGWTNASVDLGPLGQTATAYFRFRFETDDDLLTATGWYIDDISVETADTTYSNNASDYQYLTGTSMAAPYVAGLAALVWAQDGSLTSLEVKNRILNGVDTEDSLQGKVLMDGRINADTSFGASTSSPTPIVEEDEISCFIATASP